MIYIPYTYIIGWRDLDRWYYGVEYKKLKRKVANPDNLWKSYFTSSKEVTRYRQQYGEPDVCRVHRIFDSAEEARRYENKFLTRVNASNSDRWLNMTNGDIHGYSNRGRQLTDEHKQKISKIHKGKRHSRESYEKQSKSLRKYFETNAGTFTGKSHSYNSKLKNSLSHNPIVYKFYHDVYGVFEGTLFEMIQTYPSQKLWRRCLRDISRGIGSQHKGWRFITE